MQGAASSAPTSKTGFCRDAACDHARQVRFMVKTLHPFARIEMCNKCVYTEALRPGEIFFVSYSRIAKVPKLKNLKFESILEFPKA